MRGGSGAAGAASTTGTVAVAFGISADGAGAVGRRRGAAPTGVAAIVAGRTAPSCVDRTGAGFAFGWDAGSTLTGSAAGVISTDGGGLYCGGSGSGGGGCGSRGRGASTASSTPLTTSRTSSRGRGRGTYGSALESTCWAFGGGIGVWAPP